MSVPVAHRWLRLASKALYVACAILSLLVVAAVIPLLVLLIGVFTLPGGLALVLALVALMYAIWRTVRTVRQGLVSWYAEVRDGLVPYVIVTLLVRAFRSPIGWLLATLSHGDLWWLGTAISVLCLFLLWYASIKIARPIMDAWYTWTWCQEPDGVA